MAISYDEFKKVEIRAGKILSAEKIPDTDKLLKLMVDFGETFEETEKPKELTTPSVASQVRTGEIIANESDIVLPRSMKSVPRQIVSGIARAFPDPSVLIGKTCMFVTNLEPRTIKGYESNGMLFAISTPEGGFSLLEPNESIPPGTLAA